MNAKETRGRVDEIDLILDGIDRCETDGEGGWRETSTGAKFGAKKKAEVKEYVAALVRQRDELLEAAKAFVRVHSKHDIVESMDEFARLRSAVEKTEKQ